MKTEIAPQMIPIKSSNIQAAGYDKEAQKLYISFHKGPQRYIYEAVPVAVFRDLLASQSAGGYFQSCIRGKYVFMIEQAPETPKTP